MFVDPKTLVDVRTLRDGGGPRHISDLLGLLDDSLDRIHTTVDIRFVHRRCLLTRAVGQQTLFFAHQLLADRIARRVIAVRPLFRDFLTPAYP